MARHGPILLLIALALIPGCTAQSTTKQATRTASAAKPVIWIYSFGGNPIDANVEYAGCAWATGQVLLVNVFEDGEQRYYLDQLDPAYVLEIRDAVARRSSVVQREAQYIAPHTHYVAFGVLTADSNRTITWNEILSSHLASGVAEEKRRQLARDWYDINRDIYDLVQGSGSNAEEGESLKQVLTLTGAHSLEELGTLRFWKRVR